MAVAAEEGVEELRAAEVEELQPLATEVRVAARAAALAAEPAEEYLKFKDVLV